MAWEASNSTVPASTPRKLTASYGKKSRTELESDELQGFVHYLRTQSRPDAPDPNVPF
jgi:hypothetical protein